ncbi:hypothetical protein [Pontibacter sp. G13]|uniref:hypothetical protein n=1 Tax=Pontibacter sp. G13 TaxID=3074898 RepID=UPI002889B4CA|nr:hypothetical protein [Pontibacter sp. G13]WNJ19589.1 hypothetical protein RJD25_03800 [Pontibacter sp. G13]
MKRIGTHWYKALFAGMILLALGCNGDPCSDTDCGTFGTCSEVSDEALCICDTGYEPDDEGRCEIRSASRYEGTWTATETCVDQNNQTSTQTYSVVITSSSDTTQLTRIFLSNLGNFDCQPNVVGTISRSSLTIAEATYCVEVDNMGNLIDPGVQFSTSTGRLEATNDTLNLSYEAVFEENGVAQSKACEVFLVKE